jgi:APA family basic amino acid/polyamine antiporter
VVPALFIAGATFMVINTLMARPVQSLLGLGLLAIGLPVYWRGRRGRAS